MTTEMIRRELETLATELKNEDCKGCNDNDCDGCGIYEGHQLLIMLKEDQLKSEV